MSEKMLNYNPSLNKQISLKKALSLESVREVKEIGKTAGGKAQLMLFDKDYNLIGFTKFYDVEKLRKSVSLWLFRDFPSSLLGA